MFNDITIGPITIHMYGICIAAGFFLALMLCLYRAKKKGLSTDIVWGIFYCAIIGGLVGCKLLFILLSIPDIIENPSLLWDFRNGYVVYGGIIGGVLTSYIYIKIKKEDFFPYFDLVMPAVAGAQGCGRIGCFCAGCCYGRETTSAFHIMFHNSAYAPNNIPLIPTQLMSSAGDFLIMAVLIFYSSKKPKNGRVGAGYMVLYGIGRFVIEIFRADYRGSFGPFSTSQLISILIVAAGVLLFIFAPKLTERFGKKESEAAS